MTVYWYEDDILEAEELPEYDERDAADERQQIELDERNPDESA